MTPDPFVACAAEKPKPANVDKGYRVVRCNRPAGHYGQHRKIDRNTFGVLHAWDDDSTHQPH